MKKEVFFYFYISKKNGVGHYSRCSVLNYHLNKKKIKTFLLSLNKKKINTYKEFKISKIKNFINKRKNILIIDDYRISPNKILFFKKYFRNIFLIEDIPSNKKNIDVIINPNYGIKKKDYQNVNATKFFLGISYKLIKEIKFEKKRKDGFTISFGGGIVFKRIRPVLSLILKHFMKLNYKKKISIFINLTKSELNFFKKFKNLNLSIKEIGPTYQSQLSSSNFCISSLGVQHDEILKKKIPAIFFKIDKNQNYNFKISNKNNSIYTFDIKDLDEKKLSYALDRIKKKKYRYEIMKNYSKVSLGNKTFEIIKFIQKKLT